MLPYAETTTLGEISGVDFNESLQRSMHPELTCEAVGGLGLGTNRMACRDWKRLQWLAPVLQSW